MRSQINTIILNQLPIKWRTTVKTARANQCTFFLDSTSTYIQNKIEENIDRSLGEGDEKKKKKELPMFGVGSPRTDKQHVIAIALYLNSMVVYKDRYIYT